MFQWLKNLFGKSNNNNSATPGNTQTPEIPQDVFIEKNPPANISNRAANSKNALFVIKESVYIEDIHEFLTQNFEDMGYNDGLTSQDLGYSKVALSNILEQFFILTEKVCNKYHEDILTNEHEIDTLKKFGLFEQAAKKEIEKRVNENSHKQAEDYKRQAKNAVQFIHSDTFSIQNIPNDIGCRKIIFEYSRGFLRLLSLLNHKL